MSVAAASSKRRMTTAGRAQQERPEQLTSPPVARRARDAARRAADKLRITLRGVRGFLTTVTRIAYCKDSNRLLRLPKNLSLTPP